MGTSISQNQEYTQALHQHFICTIFGMMPIAQWDLVDDVRAYINPCALLRPCMVALVQVVQDLSGLELMLVWEWGDYHL
jgi:hypothetical protein